MTTSSPRRDDEEIFTGDFRRQIGVDRTKYGDAVKEIIFNVQEDDVDGGFTASALGVGINTQGETMDEIRQNVREAVACFFDDGAPEAPALNVSMINVNHINTGHAGSNGGGGANSPLVASVHDPVARHVVETIAANLRPEKVYLFGSRAGEKANPESDVDVLLICDGRENPRDIRLKTHRLFKNPSFSLDVFVQSSQEFEAQKRVANTLAREVTERGVLCYG